MISPYATFGGVWLVFECHSKARTEWGVVWFFYLFIGFVLFRNAVPGEPKLSMMTSAMFRPKPHAKFRLGVKIVAYISHHTT